MNGRTGQMRPQQYGGLGVRYGSLYFYKGEGARYECGGQKTT